MPKIKMIDLFAGIGGIRLGFDKAFGENAETVFVSEIDNYAKITYEQNFVDDFEIGGDIRNVKENEIPVRNCQFFYLQKFLKPVE